jgi:hypothetical protein
MRLRLASAATAATEALDWRLRLASAATGGATAATLRTHQTHALKEAAGDLERDTRVAPISVPIKVPV